jgi:hypothetical protein
MTAHHGRRARRLLLPFTLLLLPCLLASCQIIGVVSQALPPPTVVPTYKGLAGHSVGVMVWADRGQRIEWEFIQLDLANSIQSNLVDAAALNKKGKKAEVPELVGTTFPIAPRSIVRFQQDNPDTEGQPINEVAGRLGVSRLIYVELEEFSTRPDGGVELFRGDAKATIRIVEIGADGKAKIAYEENEVTATFPPKSPKEGRPTIGDYRTYVGLIKDLGAQVAKRFISHPEDER